MVKMKKFEGLNMLSISIMFAILLAMDIHLNQALFLSNLTVPRMIDFNQKAKLFCSYEMGNRTLNSVKWYKDGQEFFRYSPLTPPTTNRFPVKGVKISDGSYVCNQFICNIELEKLSIHSSGAYRCEVSGDAPEFKLIHKTTNMTVGVLPKFDPYISGIIHPYKYGDFLVANCSSEWSNPPATLTWYINNKTAPTATLQPQHQEITRNANGFILYSSNLQIRLHIDDPRFISTTELLQLKCVADIMEIPALTRETVIRTTIVALKDAGYNQRLIENHSDQVKPMWLIFIVTILILVNGEKISLNAKTFGNAER